MQSLKTRDLIDLSHPYLESNEKVQVIWLDDQYLLLHFFSANSCRRFKEAWEGRSRVHEESKRKLLMGMTVLPYDVYEELCKCADGKAIEAKRSRDAREDDSCLQQSKRSRISVSEHLDSRYCVFM